MGYNSDWDSGGFLGGIYPISIRLAVAEKIEKTRKIVGKFDTWVLILVDYIMDGHISEGDIGPFELDWQHFHDVIVIGPNGKLAFELRRA